MSEARHTSGLWVSTSAIESPAGFVADVLAGSLDGPTVATVRNRGQDLAEADARLIAAAPDLLAACRAGQEYIAVLAAQGMSQDRLPSEATRAILTLVRAAIAKAQAGAP